MVNLGGGHHNYAAGYDIAALESLICAYRINTLTGDLEPGGP
jgi:hypothetical protein